MRVFTDGSCPNNGKPGAKAGYAVWFPEHPEWSSSHRVPENEEQTNNRGELSAILLAVTTLEDKGQLDCDLVIYSDSRYCIDCLTTWITGWVNRGWKTSEGKDVQHQDLIKGIAGKLSKFKSHRFVHVKAHTGGTDELSKHNATVDRMANEAVTGVKNVTIPVATEMFDGCPLKVMGGPVQQKTIMDWIRKNIEDLDRDVIDKHLYKAFTELCKARDVTLTRRVISKIPVISAERSLLVETTGLTSEPADLP